MEIFTIGFTKKSAGEFFTRLEDAGVKRIVDIRLNNSSQLAGFAKKDDLMFFLQKIGGIDYVHRPDLAPSKEILDGYKKKTIDWKQYEQRFHALLMQRDSEAPIRRALKDGDCLLCSETAPERCHRRLVAEFFAAKTGGVRIGHL